MYLNYLIENCFFLGINMTQVKVTQGVLDGEVLELVMGDGKYYSFKGIPYAEPPLGKLRFKVSLVSKSKSIRIMQ